MTIKPGVRDVRAMAAVLDAEYETVEDAAEAALKAAFEVYEAKAKFMIVGHLFNPGDPAREPDDARAEWVGMGPFGTLKQAQTAGAALAYSSQTGEMSKWGAVPFWTGTPATWYKERKVSQKAAEALKDRSNPRELRHQMSVAYFEANPGATDLPEHLKGNGWDGLDEFMEWVEASSHECIHCMGTGQVRA